MDVGGKELSCIVNIDNSLCKHATLLFYGLIVSELTLLPAIQTPRLPPLTQDFPDMPWRKQPHHDAFAKGGFKTLDGFLAILWPYEEKDPNVSILLKSLRRSELLHR